MLWSVRSTSPSSLPRMDAAYSSAPCRIPSASTLERSRIRRPSSSAAWVRPRSSIRKAACSCALATIVSASSWAFSMIRSPSELIRFAARISSGIATRNSSISPSAALWSSTMLLVRGSFLPLAIRFSSRVTRKMMSIGPALPGLVTANGATAASAELSHPLNRHAQGHLGRTGHHRPHVAAELGNLAYQRGADVAVLDRGHEEDRIKLGCDDPVVVGELHLRFEIGDGPEAADDEAGPHP